MRRNTRRSLFILLKKKEIMLGSVQRAYGRERDLQAILLTCSSPNIHFTKQKTSVS